MINGLNVIKLDIIESEFKNHGSDIETTGI